MERIPLVSPLLAKLQNAPEAYQPDIAGLETETGDLAVSRRNLASLLKEGYSISGMIGGPAGVLFCFASGMQFLALGFRVGEKKGAFTLAAAMAAANFGEAYELARFYNALPADYTGPIPLERGQAIAERSCSTADRVIGRQGTRCRLACQGIQSDLRVAITLATVAASLAWCHAAARFNIVDGTKDKIADNRSTPPPAPAYPAFRKTTSDRLIRADRHIDSLFLHPVLGLGFCPTVKASQLLPGRSVPSRWPTSCFFLDLMWCEQT